MRTILYISHGGGPLPLLGDLDHKEMVSKLKSIAVEIEKPSSILVISAHWEEGSPTVTSSQNPRLIYDYNGFPAESYSIRYPCAGEPNLAHSVQKNLVNQGIDAQVDDHRGFDHGMFVPLKIMYPAADIPCVQLSLVNSLDSQLHVNIGKSLAKLDWDNLLIIGSGFSFHNMHEFFSRESALAKEKNYKFEQWLRDTVSDKNVYEKERELKLVHWDKAPFARFCHPREEHLLPLHVCYGMATRAIDDVYELTIMKKYASIFRWTQ
ncbi:DODA-type extradiol aromatic ring-opening family dioxygenase [Pleionea sediminis]|uniref:DODA-type extradiol aromatic ring-opening family dioxygenase n=1 Tax=Pleionea sediminis TaxID=2569479 RepID=UPI001186A2D4|nr:class III extradiol ring-cleavage dioxygenase [Pleionea sediminis]